MPATRLSIFHDMPVLETPRLILRKIRPSDAPALHQYASDPAVARFTTWDHYTSIADAHRFINFCLDRYQRRDQAPWAIVLKSTDTLIGTLGFTEYQPLHHKAEINYALSAAHWGQGLTPEALRAALDYAFGPLHLHRIEARCIPDNTASARVMEKVGMKREGTLRQALYTKGVFHDLHIYAILRDEWKPKL